MSDKIQYSPPYKDFDKTDWVFWFYNYMTRMKNMEGDPRVIDPIPGRG